MPDEKKSENHDIGLTMPFVHFKCTDHDGNEFYVVGLDERAE